MNLLLQLIALEWYNMCYFLLALLLHLCWLTYNLWYTFLVHLKISFISLFKGLHLICLKYAMILGCDGLRLQAFGSFVLGFVGPAKAKAKILFDFMLTDWTGVVES